MLIPVLRDRTSKPPMGTPLRSDGHWSVQGLVGAWAFNEGAGKTCYNNVSTKPGVPNNPYYVESTGVGIHLYSGHDGIVFPAAKFPIGISPYTLFASIKRESVGVNYGVMGYGSYSPAFCIEDTTGKPYVYHGGAKAKSNTGLAINVAGSVAYTRYNCSTGGLTYFVDGLPTGSATHSESIPAPNALALFSDRAESGGQALKGYGHFVCMYCIALTPSQIASLSANHWQIYEPEIVWIEVPGGAGGTAYTLSHDLSAAISRTLLVAHDTAAVVSSGLIIVADALATIATTIDGCCDTRADVATGITAAADARAAVSSAVSAAVDSRVSLSTAVTTNHDTRATLATAITSLADTLADISALTGYSVRHDTWLAISSARTWAADTRAGVSTGFSTIHDARLAVSRVIGVLADTLADISSAVGYQVNHDTRLEVRTQISRTVDSLAAISRQIAVAQDTRVMVGLIDAAVRTIRFATMRRQSVLFGPLKSPGIKFH